MRRLVDIVDKPNASKIAAIPIIATYFMVLPRWSAGVKHHTRNNMPSTARIKIRAPSGACDGTPEPAPHSRAKIRRARLRRHRFPMRDYLASADYPLEAREKEPEPSESGDQDGGHKADFENAGTHALTMLIMCQKFNRTNDLTLLGNRKGEGGYAARASGIAIGFSFEKCQFRPSNPET